MLIKMKKLNFGCGEDIREGYDNVDIQESAPIVIDFNKFPYPCGDNTYGYVWCKNVLEHLENPMKTLNELWRICKNKAEIEIIVPHYSNRSAYDSLDHRHYMSEIAFKYFEEERTYIDKEKKLKVTFLKVFPSRIGKWIPSHRIREKLSLFINGIQSYIHVKLEVVK